MQGQCLRARSALEVHHDLRGTGRYREGLGPRLIGWCTDLVELGAPVAVAAGLDALATATKPFIVGLLLIRVIMLFFSIYRVLFRITEGRAHVLALLRLRSIYDLVAVADAEPVRGTQHRVGPRSVVMLIAGTKVLMYLAISDNSLAVRACTKGSTSMSGCTDRTYAMTLPLSPPPS